MDNLTHALAGLLMAEAAVQLRAKRGPTPVASWRNAAWVGSALANNLPDIDALWAGADRPLGYLLHHRGHSHTVLLALPAGLLLGFAVAAVARRKGAPWSKADVLWLIALCGLGPLVHMAMDFSNNYGVHPFWPVYDGWVYGDAVFIVEPFFWAVGIPPLVFAARTLATRIVLGAVLALGVGLAWGVSFVPASMALTLTIVALGASLAAWRSSPFGRAMLGVGASLAVAAVFFTASSVALSAARAARAGQGGALQDIVVTPMPANPFCFSALIIETRGEEYLVRKATVATMPRLFPSRRCPDPLEAPTAPLVPSSLSDGPTVVWHGDFVAPLGELAALTRDNCQAAALFRFTRVPYWVADGKGEIVFGDLRYDRNPGLDFSDVRMPRRPASCPRGVPPWTPPRHALIGED